MEVVRVSLPFPPSVNTYYRAPTKGPLAGRHLISKRGREFRAAVADLLAGHGWALMGRLHVDVTLLPPTRRRYDVDNFSKGLLDAITHAGVWRDDEQIDRLVLEKGAVTAGGGCVVVIREVEPAPIEEQAGLALEEGTPF